MFSSNAKSYAFRPRPGDLPENSPAYTGSMVDRSELLLILLISVGVITLCSRSSFLYPLNNWDDANCFFTVGKSMFNGKVPYRDLIEQ